MPLKETMALKPKKTNRWLVACVVIIAVLLAAMATLSVYTVLTLSEQQRTLDSQHQQLLAMESAMSDAASKAESDLAEKQQQIDGQQSQLAEKNKAISDLEDTVSSLKTQISLKHEATRTPQQAEQNLPTRDYGDFSEKKIVALTFDDGPGPYTARLLDELKKRSVRATFFVLGTRVDSYPELIKRMEKEGHVVGNHSNGHKNLSKLTPAGIKTEMELCAKKIEKLLGHKPEVMRCPGGNYNTAVLNYAKEAGIPVIQWGVDTRDWESRNVNAILNKCFAKNGIKDGSIVLMHDIYSTTVDATVQMVDRLIAEGYTFVTVPELIHDREGKIEAGKMYR